MNTTKDIAYLTALAQRYLARRMRSVQETRQYLLRKAEKHNLAPQLVEAVIAALKQSGLLEDVAFTNWYKSSRAHRLYGERRTNRELLRLGVAQEVVKNIVQPHVELNTLVELIKRRYPNFNDPKVKQKALAFLLRRGFTYEIANQAIKQAAQT